MKWNLVDFVNNFFEIRLFYVLFYDSFKDILLFMYVFINKKERFVLKVIYKLVV